MNLRKLAQVVETLTPEQKDELMNLQTEVTEKVHGTSFRAGFTNTGKRFIASRKQVFFLTEDNKFLMKQEKSTNFNEETGEYETQYVYREHPKWNVLGEHIQNQLVLLLNTIKPPREEEFIF